MSLARKAAGGALWASGATLGSRLVTIASTFVLTRFLAPSVQGEVNLAFVLLATAGAASSLGVQQFIVAHPTEERETTFHGTVMVLALGVLVCLACVFAAPYLGAWIHVPGMARYVPGMALSHFIDRCGWTPRGVLLREMRFRAASLCAAAGELTFAVSSVLFARAGRGGDAIVAGNIARSLVVLGLFVAMTNARDYLSPSRLSMERAKKILRFGMPLAIANLFAIGATSWDNSFMGYRFGEALVGLYNQAYRLAELPLTTVADPMNDVLVPALARTQDLEARRRGFLRAASLMALVEFPMCVGLSVIAPAMVQVFYPKTYGGVAPLLVVLGPLSMARSLNRLAGAFLQVANRTRTFMWIDLARVIAVLGSMAALSVLGPTWSAIGVVLAYFVILRLTLGVLREEGIPVAATLRAVMRPFFACAPMAAVVIAAHRLLSPHDLRAPLLLGVELVLGAITYVGSALVIAPKESRELTDLGRSLLARRREKA